MNKRENVQALIAQLDGTQKLSWDINQAIFGIAYGWEYPLYGSADSEFWDVNRNQGASYLSNFDHSLRLAYRLFDDKETAELCSVKAMNLVTSRHFETPYAGDAREWLPRAFIRELLIFKDRDLEFGHEAYEMDQINWPGALNALTGSSWAVSDKHPPDHLRHHFVTQAGLYARVDFHQFAFRIAELSPANEIANVLWTGNMEALRTAASLRDFAPPLLAAQSTEARNDLEP